MPTKARLLKNRIGTASGLLFSEKGKTLVLLPGVPQEMRPMFENELLPILPEYAKREEQLATTMVHFGLLREDDVDPILRELHERYPEMDFGIYPSYGILSVRLTCSNSKTLKACKGALEELFANYLFEDTEGKIEHAIHHLFIERKLKLSCAESCTGGQIAAKITGIPGASNYFVASLVAYSNEMKEELLGVKKATLQTFGAVSREVALEMAQGLIKRTGADYGIAITGIAGPDGGTQEKPVGTVWIAMAQKEGANEAIRLQLRGSRETITASAVYRSLFFLYRKVAKGDSLTQWERP